MYGKVFHFKFLFASHIYARLQILMRKQITFQAVYVNNAIEYQGSGTNQNFPPLANKENGHANV